jgi:hypothetical protein
LSDGTGSSSIKDKNKLQKWPKIDQAGRPVEGKQIDFRQRRNLTKIIHDFRLSKLLKYY